ncbi:hypothetical protein HZA87_00205 [Candidatus Uhrbacteria bacterium]|nr:hypothetical protein [Candidatus Uhrbacteria bacterium]
MVYGGSKERQKIRWGSTIGTSVLVLILFVLFVFAVRWFRAAPVQEPSAVSSIADVFTPDPISQAVIDNAIDTESKTATLKWAATAEAVGEARRGEKDDKFYVEFKLSLPEIDREVQYYQVWLLRKIPYDFFSLGEMITDEEGNFVLEWQAPDAQDYSGYSEIVMTVNDYEGSADPGAHLVEGTFGE